MYSNNSNNDVVRAYIDFITNINKTGAEVYAKTWQDATKLSEAVTKSTQDIWKDNPFMKSLSNVWDMNSSYKSKD